MRHRPAILFAAATLAACASLVKPNVETAPEALRAGAYALDQEHASLLFKIDHFGFSRYVGRFEAFDASLDFDVEAPTAARVDATIDMASLDIANDAFARTLMGPQWFDAKAYPQAVFRSTGVATTGAGAGRLTGDLTLHGVTRKVTLEVTFNGGARDMIRGAYVVGFSATGTISRKAFGVDAFDGLVGDDVRIEIEAEFKRQ